MSEVIDILGQAEIMDHGQIAIMQLPDWELEDVETGTIASKKIYRHPDHPDVQFVFYYRGRPVGDNAAACFESALSSEHTLSMEELADLEQILGERNYSEYYQMFSADTECWNGRNVLTIRGKWIESDIEELRLYVRAGSPEYVQEISFEAPGESFQEFYEIAMLALKSVVWIPDVGSSVNDADPNKKIEFDVSLLAESQQLGTGSFSKVYKYSNDESGESFAVKVLEVDNYPPSSPYATRVWRKVFDRFEETEVSPSELISKQYDQLLGIECGGWATVQALCCEGERAFVSMDLVEAPSLRDLIDCSSYNLEILKSLSSTLSEVVDSKFMLHHGDLKPDHILVSRDFVKLIAPGYFGPVKIGLIDDIDVAITTWQYYPWMELNDMFAFGLIALELCAGVHPFSDKLQLEPAASKLGPELSACVAEASQAGNQFVKNLELLPSFLSRFNRHITEELKNVALRCMGIEEHADGTLEMAHAYESFRQLSEDLACVTCPDEILIFRDDLDSHTEFYSSDQSTSASTIEVTDSHNHQPYVFSMGIPVGVDLAHGDDCVRIGKKERVQDEFQIVTTSIISVDGSVHSSSGEAVLSIHKVCALGAAIYLLLTRPKNEIGSQDLLMSVWVGKVVNRSLLVPASIDEINQMADDKLLDPTPQLLSVMGEFAL